MWGAWILGILLLLLIVGFIIYAACCGCGSSKNNCKPAACGTGSRSGGLIERQVVYEESGDFVAPRGVRSVIVELWGAGGGGGGAGLPLAGTPIAAGGGGAGAYLKDRITVRP